MTAGAVEPLVRRAAPSSRASGPRARSRDGGYTLVAIMIFITLLSIAILAVSPSVTMMMRRDREQELLFRGKQYAQAILNFQKRQGRYPLNLKELMKTKPRSARKLYREPICNCDDWGLIRVGQPWPPPKPGTNPAGDSMTPGSTPTTGQPAPGPPGQTRPGSPFPTTYTTPPPGGSSTGDSAAGSDSGNSESGGDSAGGLDFGGKKEGSNAPILGVYSKIHRKGLQTFHGMEYYDQWGFIAGANNDPDILGMQPSSPFPGIPTQKPHTSIPSPGPKTGSTGPNF
ncbi:MAG TPA: type II secretion system protein [Thermoanaerobaculia bacterium]|nr:type II secretion system protein [Thermoanaerobaculia bacterium]